MRYKTCHFTFHSLLLILISLCLISSVVWAQDDPATTSILDGYVQQGLKSNLSLKQHHFDYEKSKEGLKEAKLLFAPNVTMTARYSFAHGGRSFEVDANEFVQPVLTTLNDYLQNFPVPVDPFPAIELEQQDLFLLRSREHDTKVRVVQPIDYKLLLNRDLQEQLVGVEREALKVFQRELVAEIKTAYFNYLIASEALKIYRNGLALLKENRRVNQKLIENNLKTSAELYRVDAEISGLEADLAGAEKDSALAQNFFNFLLNKSCDEPILKDSLLIRDIDQIDAIVACSDESPLGREELAQLDQAIAASATHVAIEKANYLPNMAAVFDYGFEGEKYRFSSDHDYWIASFVLTWNISELYQGRQKVAKASIDHQKLMTQRLEIERQLGLQMTEANHKLKQAWKVIVATSQKRRSARKNFDAVRGRFKVQKAPQIEFLDARNTLTQSEIEVLIAQYELLKRRAEYERVAATYKLPELN